MGMQNGLFQSFCSIVSLGFSYSLADYDFFDSNNCFPDKGYDWIYNNLHIEKTKLIPENWSQEDILNLKFQLDHCCIKEKKYHWSDVSVEYLEKHYFGLFHVNQESFLFYLPAWMLGFNGDDSSKLSLSNLFFFSVFSSLTFRDEKYYDWLNKEQRKEVIEFLSGINGEWAPQAELAHMMWSSAIDDGL